MAKRLSAQDWVDFALRTLVHDGFDALKADVLARKLGVSRGSFYWHFADIAVFHARVIERWKQAATEAVIADIEQFEAREARLAELLRRAFGEGAALEVRMRAWADSNAVAARALDDIERRRRAYIEGLLVELGVAQPQAATRAQLLYWTYLGAAFSRSRLTGTRLDGTVAALMRLALGGRPGKRDTAAGGRTRAAVHRSGRQP